MHNTTIETRMVAMPSLPLHILEDLGLLASVAVVVGAAAFAKALFQHIVLF